MKPVAKKRHILLTFLCCLIYAQSAWSQFYFYEDAHDQVEVNFLRKKIETLSNKAFFNAVKIANPTSQKLTFIANFSYPAGWTFMGDQGQRYTIEPNDSIIIPFRASAPKTTRGEIGYSIVVSLTDLRGNVFKNAYSFVNIPKVQEISFAPENRTIFIDQYKRDALVGLKFANTGNTEEVFHIDYHLPSPLTTRGEHEGLYIDEISLKPYRDTIIHLPVNLRDRYSDNIQTYHRIQVDVSTADTAMKSTIWARELRNHYYNPIQSSYTMLGVELTARNLIAESDPSLSADVWGNFLLKRAGSIYFRAMANNIESGDWERMWRNGRYEIRYDYKNSHLWLGDIQQLYALNIYGRGGLFSQKLNNNVITAIATKSMYSDVTDYGASYEYNNNKFSAGFGGAYEQDKDNQRNIIGAFINGEYKNKTLGNIDATLNLTNAMWQIGNKSTLLGIGIDARYSNSIANKWFIYAQTHFGQPQFFGRYAGRLELTSQLQYYISQDKHLLASYNRTNNGTPRFIGDSMLRRSIVSYDEIKLTYNKNITKHLYYYVGGISESRHGDNFNSAYPEIQFSTRNVFATAMVRFRKDFNLINFNIKGGPNFVTEHPAGLDTLKHNNAWLSIVANASWRSQYGGLYLNYYHGPNSLSQQFTHYMQNGYPRTVRLMPYLDFYIYPQYVQYQNKTSFSYDIGNKTTRINLSNDLIFYLGKTTQLVLTHTWNFSSSYDVITEEQYRYKGSYVEARLRKDFNFDQPRYKLCDLEITFYKDLNGNHRKDEDEPGVKDVLFSITQNEGDGVENDQDAMATFMAMELLSDMNGNISYKNIPSGFYNIEYQPIGEVVGAYTTETSRQSIYINRNMKLEIPFAENNKIFGRIVMNRSRLSNLGQVDISNVKVSAEDTHGKIHSTLTDKDGNFTLYVPSVDKYNVKVNNIFYENFDIEQNSYEVQLNGYRQFEVNFVFNEKRRKINFTTTQEYGLNESENGIEMIRRTTMTGTIKDATTLQPIAANIKVTNSRGKVIANSSCNAKTGLYNIEFIAGNDYTIEVEADGYWFYSEKLRVDQAVTFSNDEKDVMLKQIINGATIPMNNLNFASRSTEIPAVAFPELERLLKVLRQNPSVKIAVYGHADDIEIRETNVDIAQERARIVASYLIANGYSRIKYLGYSNTRPIADNDTEEGRAQNRRVEIVVTDK